MTEQPTLKTRPRLHRRGYAYELISTIVFMIAAFTLLEMAIPRSIVQSISMEPNLIENQRLVISRLSYLLDNPHRGEIVVFLPPDHRPEDPPLIKRLIGLPGETVEFRNTELYIDGVRLDEPYINEPCDAFMCSDRVWVLGPDEYFMMGDNRNHSHDSRSFGPVKRERIVGRAVLRYWPPSKWGILSYSYEDSPGQSTP
ncbi:MAG: signal peptidase I [Anaerolineaceae bacterium]|nr:signal peptidase I [Anaerolineaceae bacterium]